MPTPRSRRALALAGVLLLAIVAGGCARRDAGSAVVPGATDRPAASATVAPDVSATAAPASADTSQPSASPSAPAATPAASPVPTPDLAPIQLAINAIDNDLGADATAGADEGSAP